MCGFVKTGRAWRCVKHTASQPLSWIKYVIGNRKSWFMEKDDDGT